MDLKKVKEVILDRLRFDYEMDDDCCHSSVDEIIENCELQEVPRELVDKAIEDLDKESNVMSVSDTEYRAVPKGYKWE